MQPRGLRRCRLPPFEIDPRRLYDVAPDGTPRTDDSRPPEWLDARHRRVLGWTALSAGLLGMLVGLTVLTFALGARLTSACFALATMAVAPLLGLGPVLDWWRYRRPYRRRHRSRPGNFPPG